jgi:NodT family efflux transporter outer membrane factor (OMF) lipoprotein
MKRASALLAIILLSGCAAVADGPSPASVNPPPLFAYAPPQESRAPLDDLLPRDDPAFVLLVAAVDADAPDLQAALARVEIARGALRTAAANRRPSIDASGAFDTSRSSENAVANLPPGAPFDATSNLWSLGITASWDPDLFGRLKASQRAAAQRLDAATADARAVRLTLVSDIARAVVDYRTAQEKMRISKEDLADATALVKLTSIRVRAGLSPGFDLVRAQGLEAAAKAALPPAEEARAAALGRLVTLTARDGPTVAAAFDTTSPALHWAKLPTVGLPAALLRQRPDVAAAEYRLLAANEEIAAAAAARFPQFSITSALGLAALALGDFFSADSLTASAGASVAGPLLDFGRVAAQIDARQAEAKEAFALYRSAVFLAIGEAETALGTLQATSDRLTALEAQLVIERDSVNLAQQRYRMGLSDFLTVIDAQRQLNGTRQILADAQGNAGQGAIEVYRKFGGA